MLIDCVGLYGFECDRASIVIGGSDMEHQRLILPGDLGILRSYTASAWWSVRHILIEWGEPALEEIISLIHHQKALYGQRVVTILNREVWCWTIEPRIQKLFIEEIDDDDFIEREYDPRFPDRQNVLVLPWDRDIAERLLALYRIMGWWMPLYVMLDDYILRYEIGAPLWE
jgi:hypothetical protein